MFSISFLPWLLLLLAIILSVPIVSFVETNRRKKALAAATSEAQAGEGEPDDEGVFAEDPASGFGEEAVPAGGGFGQPEDAELAGFDDDAFK